MEIITQETIYKVQDVFKHFQHAYVYGKGPTFNVMDKRPMTMTCCINQTINIVGYADLLVVNDIEIFDTIQLDKLKNVRSILMPYHIHKNHGARKEITYKNVVDKIQHYFNGYLIVYNLETCFQKYSMYISLPSKVVFSSTHTACDFIFGFLQNIQYIDTYGFGKHASRPYHQYFGNVDPQMYNNGRINELIGNMNRISTFYKKKIIYN